MLEVGDTVFGVFPCIQGHVIRHYSVVVEASPQALVLVYTTSQVDGSKPVANEFTVEERRLAGFKKRCFFSPGEAGIVSPENVRKVGALPRAAMERVVSAYLRNKKSRTLKVAAFVNGEIVTA